MWKMFAVPVVGAVIGYITNWIAVKMLFRPRHEVKIGGWKVPFTPGIIPKGQPRLAKAIGRAVETQLLTPEVMREMLLSEEQKKKLADKVRAWVDAKEASDTSIQENVLKYMDEESWNELKLYTCEELSAYLMKKLMEMNPGKVLTEKVMEAANEKLAESVFGMMLGGGFLEGIAATAETMINEYLEQNGEAYLEQLAWKEFNQLQEKPAGGILVSVEKHAGDLSEIVVRLYENILEEYLVDMVKSLQLCKVVEDRINAMKVEEVEELVLSIMKKELGAVVNLGAVIGFLLGLINVAILYL